MSKILAIGDSITAKENSWADLIGAEKRAEGGHTVVDRAPVAFAVSPTEARTTVLAVGTNDANVLAGRFGHGRRLLAINAHLAITLHLSTVAGPSALSPGIIAKASTTSMTVEGDAVAVIYTVADGASGWLTIRVGSQTFYRALNARLVFGGFVRSKRGQTSAPAVLLVRGLKDGPHNVSIAANGGDAEVRAVIGSASATAPLVVANMYQRTPVGWADGRGSEGRTRILNEAWRRNVLTAHAFKRDARLWRWDKVVQTDHLAPDGTHLNGYGDQALASDWLARMRQTIN